jgi:hypothetical protein
LKRRGGFESYTGGLTLINAAGIDKAGSAGRPMNEIGKTAIMVWDLFYADL